MITPDIRQVVLGLLSQAGKNQVIELVPGQVITVTPKEIKGDLAVLAFRGKELLARLDAPAAAGERLRCVVEGETNGQIILKVVPEVRGDLTGEGMRKLAAGLGLPDDYISQRLVGEMIRQEMPLNHETARVLGSFVRSAKIPDADIWIAVFMQKNGMGISEQSFHQVRNLLTDLKFMQPEVSRLLDRLQTLLGFAEVSGELKQPAAKLLGLIKSLQVDSSAGREAAAAQLAEAFRTLNSQPGSMGLSSLLKDFASVLTNGGEQFSDLAELTSGLAGKFEVLHDFNLKAGSNPESLLMMHSMVRFGDREEPFRLLVKYRSDEKNARRDFSSCRLEISLNTESLGLVSCEVNVNYQNLALQFLAENESSAAVIDRTKKALGETLKGLNFSVTMPECEVRPGDQNFILDDKQDISGLFQLNIRV